MTEALKTFHKNKIRVANEEAGTSHINQPYDQGQTKADKRAAGQLLELVRERVTNHIDQWQLCTILCIAIKNLPEKIWEQSFIKVNLHPHHRVSFKEWIMQIDAQVPTGEAAYTHANKESIFDAMPGFWKAMQIEERQHMIQCINGLKTG